MFCFYGFVSQFIPQAFLGVKLEMAKLAHLSLRHLPSAPLVLQLLYGVLCEKKAILCIKGIDKYKHMRYDKAIVK